jgi:tight adherence protein C
MDFALLTPFAVFGAIAAGAWWLLETFSRGRGNAERRLEELKDPRMRRRGDEGAVKKADSMTRALEKASPALAKPLQPKNEFEANKLRQRLAYAGFRGETASTVFLGIKFVGLLIGLFLGGGSLLLFTGFTMNGLFKAAMFAGGFFYAPDALLWWLGKRRKDQIFFGLPDALDLMVVCVEAGLGLDQAMRRVADEMKKSYRVISEEFGLCNLQLQMGRRRAEVLHELGQRTGVDDLRALASILIQADKFGSSVAQALRVQSESMRTRRKQIAEEKAAKTAVKLIFPLVIFIFPGIFVVLVGPAAITMIREMFPAMNGGQ